MLGVQGGGKSLAAKAVAGIWNIPLLRLDFGVLCNKFFAETERNMREALQTAEVMAPCVLWCDEIEKGISTGDYDSGTAKRVLGTLLTWMAFHEITGDYPWLTKRMGRLRAGDSYSPPRRYFFAWLLACFVPRFGLDAGSALIMIAIIGILAAVAIPAYQDYTVRAHITEGLGIASTAKVAASEFYSNNGSACESNKQCGVAAAEEITNGSVSSVSVGEGSVITVTFSVAPIDGTTILLEPYLDDDDRFRWRCTGGSLANKYRPSSCREQ